MNNAQFRRLLSDNSNTASKSHSSPQDASSTVMGSQTPALGSRARSSIPMTPRSVAGYSKSRAASDFAKQVEDHTMGPPPAKKFKSSAAPKGSKLADGYTDRAKMRQQQDEKEGNEEKQRRVEALDAMVKAGQMEKEVFEKLKREILGGAADGEGRVKGLDWNLLRRARAGEDVISEVDMSKQKSHEEKSVDQTPLDVDAELEDALGTDDAAPSLDAVTKRKQQKKKGNFAPPPGKLSRDDILRKLKESRQQIEEQPPESSLSTKFKKLSSTKPRSNGKKRWTEVDEATGRRREVLLTTDKDGNPKRKVRWLAPEDIPPPAANSDAAKSKRPKRKRKDQNDPLEEPETLGADLPAELAARQKAYLDEQQRQEDDADSDIFEGVGAEYDPMAGVSSDSSSSDTGSESGEEKDEENPQSGVHEAKIPPPRPDSQLDTKTQQRRDYFSTATTENHADETDTNSHHDPTLLAAIKRAAALRHDHPRDSSPTSSNDDQPTDRSQAILSRLRAQDRQDAADLDMGFGDGGFGADDDEDDGGDVILEGEEERKTKKSGRKRGSNKKKKGDKENVDDVMRVLEGRRDDGGKKEKRGQKGK
ncbi:MAG: hypothetical protein Q9227_008672 [Pyrenula ochraceoflavens]